MDYRDLNVRRAAADEISAVHALGRDTFTEESQCTPGAFWPDVRQLETVLAIGGGIYIASHGSADIGFIAVEPSGQVAWLRAAAAHIGLVCAVCTAHAYADIGSCWGPVGNADVRAAAVAAADGHLVDDSGVLRYVP